MFNGNGSGKKGGYEAVPDVEKGTLPAPQTLQVDAQKATDQAKQKYSDLELDNDQARLLGTLDEALAHTSLDLNLNGHQVLVDSPTNGWTGQVLEFVRDMIQPTLTAAATCCVAFYLQKEQQRQQETMKMQDTLEFYDQSWTAFAITLFPYINATVLFLAMVMPLTQRFLTAVTPIWVTFNQIEDILQAQVRALGPFVDQIIDGIQRDFHICLEPIQPTLDQLEGKAHLLEGVMAKNKKNSSKEEEFNIPDPSDIDRELDEAQGIVGQKVKDAEQHLEYQAYVPDYLDSPRQFYWRIVVPALLLAWGLQMALAYGQSHHARTAAFNEPPHRLLQHDSSYGVLPATPLAPTYDHDGDGEHHYYSQMNHTDHSLSHHNLTDKSPDDYQDKYYDTYKDSLEQYENRTTDRLDAWSNNMTNQINDLVDRSNAFHNPANSSWRDSLTHNATDQLKRFEENFDDQFRTGITQSQTLVHDVLWSYAMAMLQMLAVYLLTRPVVQAWVVRQGMHQVQKGAERTLDEYGVSKALAHVEVRLDRARTKILKLLRVYKKAQQVLGKVLPNGALDRVDDALKGSKKAQDAMNKGKQFANKFFK